MSAASEMRIHNDAPHIPGEVVVQFAPSVSATARISARASVDGRRAGVLGPPGLELVDLADTSVSEAIARLEARPDVLYAEPNYVVEALGLPNDPSFADQWSLNDPVDGMDINALPAWDTTEGEGTLVAIVDTGVAWDHPDIAPNVWTNESESGGSASNGIDDDSNGFIDDVRGWDWIGNDNDPSDISGHGTHVAGTVAAQTNNGLGVAGVAGDAKILPLRVLGSSGAGNSADVARAFWYAADAGAEIVNASFGSSGFSRAVSDAVSNNPDVLFVAAAGNAGTNNDEDPMWPCNLSHSNVVCVTAVGRDGTRPGFANYGSTSVDIAAPGTAILSAKPDVRYPLNEYFESDADSRWVTGGTASWGPMDGPHGVAYADSPTSNYASNANTWLAMRSPIDTSGLRNCAVTFRLKMDVVRGDIFSIETSTDGSTWHPNGAFYGSTGGAWDSTGIDLDAAGKPIQLRFRLRSDDAMTGDGIAIDNVSVQCAASDYGPAHYGYSSGTSMATPHVSGVAALLYSVAPDASVSTIRSALFESATQVPTLEGLIAIPARVDAAGGVALLAPEGSVLPDPDVTPAPTVTELPELEPTPEPTPIPTPTPEITPDPGSEVIDHSRSLTTKIVRGPRLRGKVSSDDFEACAADVRVIVRRNGRVLKRVTTDDLGRFKVKIPSRRGRYRSVTSASQPVEGHSCSKAVSVSNLSG